MGSILGEHRFQISGSPGCRSLWAQRSQGGPHRDVSVSCGREVGVFSSGDPGVLLARPTGARTPLAGVTGGLVASRKPRPEEGSLRLCFVLQRAAGPAAARASREAAGGGERVEGVTGGGGRPRSCPEGRSHRHSGSPALSAIRGARPTCSDP